MKAMCSLHNYNSAIIHFTIITLRVVFHLNEYKESTDAARIGACIVGSNVDSPSAALG